MRAQVSSAGRPVYALAFCDKAPQVLAVTCNNTVVVSWKPYCRPAWLLMNTSVYMTLSP